jgi:hypothetical protein
VSHPCSPRSKDLTATLDPRGRVRYSFCKELVDRQGAAFWLKAAELFERLAHAPGFIRRFSFADGPCYLIAFCGIAADAYAFFSTDEHQAAMLELFRHRWASIHFAPLCEINKLRQRVTFCQQCDAVRQRPTASAPAAVPSCSIHLPSHATTSSQGSDQWGT